MLTMNNAFFDVDGVHDDDDDDGETLIGLIGRI